MRRIHVRNSGSSCCTPPPSWLSPRRVCQLTSPRHNPPSANSTAPPEGGGLGVGGAVDGARQGAGTGELERFPPSRRRDARVRPDRSDPAVRVNKNGAVLEGRRRDWMDPAGSDAQQEFRV